MSEDWHLFADSRFELHLRYPTITPQGYAVEKTEYQREDAARVHWTSQDSDEVYFEVVKFLGLSPQGEYQRHEADLVQRFKGLMLSPLQSTSLDGLPAFTYTFAWPHRERTVVLVEMDGATYRILYNPRSSLNTQILETVVLPK